MLSPLAITLIQSTTLNAISNILAQIIDQYRHNKPFALNIIALVQFVTYAVLIIPINFSWQKYLESRFPGSPVCRGSSLGAGASATGSHTSGPASDDLPVKEDEKKPWRGGVTEQPPSGMRNFIIKFLLDQTVGGVINIFLFIVLINLLKGAGVNVLWDAVREHFCPIMLARLKYRPVISTLMYTVVPVDRRVVFGSACGVVWGIYLSLYAAV